jgi:hypothetical protein
VFLENKINKINHSTGSGQPSAPGANAQTSEVGSRDRSGRERVRWGGSRIDGRIDGIPDTMLNNYQL